MTTNLAARLELENEGRLQDAPIAARDTPFLLSCHSRGKHSHLEPLDRHHLSYFNFVKGAKISISLSLLQIE